MSRHPLVAAAVASVLFLGGCAASVSRPDTAAPAMTVAPAAASRVYLQMTPPAGAAADGDWQAFQEEWKTAMSAAASAKSSSFRLLNAGEKPPAGSGTLLRMKVNEFRYASQAKRYGLGVFTGNASMDVDVDFVELPGGKLAGSRKYSTTSSAWQGIFSAMTPKQVEAVSQEIFSEIGRR